MSRGHWSREVTVRKDSCSVCHSPAFTSWMVSEPGNANRETNVRKNTSVSRIWTGVERSLWERRVVLSTSQQQRCRIITCLNPERQIERQTFARILGTGAVSIFVVLFRYLLSEKRFQVSWATLQPPKTLSGSLQRSGEGSWIWSSRTGFGDGFPLFPGWISDHPTPKTFKNFATSLGNMSEELRNVIEMVWNMFLRFNGLRSSSTILD